MEQDIPEILPGKALAKLEIPRMGKEGGDALLVVPGVDLDSLQQGPGHYPDTPLPGQLGNAAIAGHRTTWGEPFARIDELVPGDEIIVTMLTGDRFVYEVASTEIVSPDDYYVVQTTDPTVAELTLTSCHPRWSARQRIAVHAFLQPEESAPVGDAHLLRPRGQRPRSRRASATDEPGDDPTITVPDDTATATDDTGDTTATGRHRRRRRLAATRAPVTIAGPDGPDALTAGWFHDSAAWPQIVLWGAVCSAIAILAYRISRRFRNLRDRLVDRDRAVRGRPLLPVPERQPPAAARSLTAGTAAPSAAGVADADEAEREPRCEHLVDQRAQPRA